MPETAADAFGFSDVRKDASAKLQRITPSVAPIVEGNSETTDAIADRRGFVSRDPIQELPARSNPSVMQAPTKETGTARSQGVASQAPLARKAKEPFQHLTLRMPVSQMTVLRDWCELNRYTYSEGVGLLMQQAGLLK